MTAISGTLYVVATPIGNLGDFSPRAREVLAQADVIAAEDTRHTGQLLKAFGIHTPMLSLHEHNEAARAQALIDRLMKGESIALVSDAGTPLISDPGFNVVAAARGKGINVVAVPGACAAIAALSIAGLPTDRFTFEGFLPSKSTARRAALEALSREARTMVFYESPHRVRESIEDMHAIFGADRKAAICREITKQFETTYAGTLAELQRVARENADLARGEIVIVIAGSDAPPASAATLNAEQLLRALLEDLSPSQAAKIAARITDRKRSELYEEAMRLKGGD
jgi:16S rRNA (cytidine1402-2'-O)-methyltransferase